MKSYADQVSQERKNNNIMGRVWEYFLNKLKKEKQSVENLMLHWKFLMVTTSQIRHLEKSHAIESVSSKKAKHW